MLNSKEEARSEGYKRLLDEARAEAVKAVARAEAAELLASELKLDLASTGARLTNAEAMARLHSVAVTRLTRDFEGAKADLLATTRRAIMGEVILKDASDRIERLRGAVEQIATWPLAHSAEAKSMREAAKRCLKKDERARGRGLLGEEG